MSDAEETIARGIELTRKQKFAEALRLFTRVVAEVGASDEGKKLLANFLDPAIDPVFDEDLFETGEMPFIFQLLHADFEFLLEQRIPITVGR